MFKSYINYTYCNFYLILFKKVIALILLKNLIKILIDTHIK